MAARMQKIQQRRKIGGGQEEIDEGEACAEIGEFARILADEAPHEGDDEGGILLLEFGDVRQARVDLVFGLLAHDAGVEEQKAGVAGMGNGAEAGGFQSGGGAQGIGLVHLAPDGPEVVGWRRSRGRPPGGRGISASSFWARTWPWLSLWAWPWL